MESQSISCNEIPLELILNDDDASVASLSVMEHFESCTHCQTRLSELAASKGQWANASRLLMTCDSTGALRSQTSLDEKSMRESNGQDWAKSMANQLLEPSSHPEMLGRIGRFDVERLIGSGGMGVVFKAYDSELNRPVAIKVLAPYLAGNGSARQRFSREAKAAAAVVHDHVVPIHNVETNTPSPYLVMHYVAGESLQTRIDRLGALSPCEVLRIAMQVASGLAAAHAHGLVHRDIKPPNILLEQGVERSLITDFGLARTADDASLTNTGVHAGTPQYMSPEQAKGEAIDSRSDLFSLGSTMYTMCTGRAPFRAETAYGILRKIIETEPHPIRDLNAEVPEWLCSIIFKLMAKNPDQRFDSAGELSSLLAECLAHVQTPVQNPLPESLRKPTQRSILIPRLVIGTCLVTCVAVALVGWSLRNGTWTAKEVPSSVPSSIAEDPAQREAIVPQSTNVNSSANSQQSTNADNSDRPQRYTIRPAAGDALRDRLISVKVEPFVSNSAEQAIQQLSELLEISIRWNPVHPPETKEIQIAVFPMSGREALRAICDQVGGAYIIHEDSIELCSREYAQNHPVVRYYDLAHVLASNRNMNAIVHAIEDFTEPALWAQGKCSISILDTVLIVRATESMHSEIELLLSSLTMLQPTGL